MICNKSEHTGRNRTKLDIYRHYCFYTDYPQNTLNLLSKLKLNILPSIYKLCGCVFFSRTCGCVFFSRTWMQQNILFPYLLFMLCICYLSFEYVISFCYFSNDYVFRIEIKFICALCSRTCYFINCYLSFESVISFCSDLCSDFFLLFLFVQII